MRLVTLTINHLLAPTKQPSHFWPVVGLTAVFLGGIYILRINQNLLFLSMLFALIALLSLFLPRWWMAFLLVGACVYLAGVQAKVVEARFFVPAPQDALNGD